MKKSKRLVENYKMQRNGLNLIEALSYADAMTKQNEKMLAALEFISVNCKKADEAPVTRWDKVHLVNDIAISIVNSAIAEVYGNEYAMESDNG